MNKLIHFIVKQYNVGLVPGAIHDQITGVAGYVAIINFALITPTAYHTTLREPLTDIFPWITFWLFASIIVILIMCAWVFRWKIMIPSQMAYLNYMKYKHQDLIRRDIGLLSEQVRQLRKEVRGKK